MDRGLAKELSNELLEKAKEVGKEYGLEVSSEGARYSNSSTIIRIKFLGVNKNGETEAEENWRLNCGRYDLKPEWFGKVFQHGNDRFKIVDLKPRRRKYPVSCICERNNSKFKFPSFTVVDRMMAEEAKEREKKSVKSKKKKWKKKS